MLFVASVQRRSICIRVGFLSVDWHGDDSVAVTFTTNLFCGLIAPLGGLFYGGLVAPLTTTIGGVTSIKAIDKWIAGIKVSVTLN